MTREQLMAKMHQSVHLTWKHAFLIGAGVVSAMIALASTTAVHGSKIADHSKILDERAGAVTELARVAQEVRGEAQASAEFRQNTAAQLQRLETKLDRALEK